jgi:ADP-ribose pyrophosphatase YjhB (NUDIX family)
MSHYCYECGKLLSEKIIEGRVRETCDLCGWINYEHRKISAGVRVQKDGLLLLVQRGLEPWYGKWYLPAGFVEVDEEPDHAAVRETYEETGLIVKINKIVDLYTYNDDPRGNGIVLLYDAVVTGGALTPSSEALQSGFYSPEQIKNMPLAGACVDMQVRDWLAVRTTLLKEAT